MMRVRATSGTYRSGIKTFIHAANCKDGDQGGQDDPREFESLDAAKAAYKSIGSTVTIYGCAKAKGE